MQATEAAVTPAMVLGVLPADAGADERRYLVLECTPHAGAAAGGKGGIVIESRRVRDGAVIEVEQRAEGSGALLAEQRWRLDDEGRLIVERHVNHARGVVVEFTPRLVLMPRAISPGSPDVQRMRLRLPKIAEPRSLRAKGTARRELSCLGVQLVRHGDSEWRAACVREVMTNELDAARAVRTTDRWYDTAGVAGLVAERYEEEVTALGVTVERSSRTMVRVE